MDARRLRGLGETGLAAVLVRRPEAATPPPASLAELASRLTDPATVLAALRRLVLPSVQVAEALAALRSQADRPTLDRLLGDAEPDAVDRALSDLAEHGLLVIDGEALTLIPTVRLAWDSPLGLGPPVEECLGGMRHDDLRSMCLRLGATPSTVKANTIAILVECLRDGDRMRSIVATAAPQIQQLLARVAGSGELIMVEHGYGPMGPGPKETVLAWVVERGLLQPTGPWGNEYVMPAEVTLSLRGPGYSAPFEPHEPFCPRAPADPATVERDAAAAAGAFLRLAGRVLDDASRARLATIRSGGVGIRELRRLAKASDTDVDQVRLVLALSHRAGLLTTTGDSAVPTESYDAWLAVEPTEQLAALLQAWWSLPYSPLAKEGGWEPSGPSGPPGPSDLDIGVPELRAGALRLAAAEPGALTDAASFVERLHWRHPYLLRADFETFTAVAVAWRVEATSLGIMGAGAVSEAGLALLADDPVALLNALAGVGQSARTAHLQADLTAVVAGTPSPVIADLLAAVADRESTGAASTWRFSPDSVRRALDTGWTADGLLTSLAEIATAGVPQALTYLIRDVQRRHGVIRAQSVVCCLRSDDTALLAELAADRRLRPLGLRLLAPTVLAGSKPLAETLAALRKSGYAPVEEAADGSTVVESTTRRRTALPPRSRRAMPDEHGAAPANLAAALATARRRAVTGHAGGPDVLALARTLLGRPDGTFRPPPESSMLDLIDDDLPDGYRPRPYPPYRPPFPRRRYY